MRFQSLIAAGVLAALCLVQSTAVGDDLSLLAVGELSADAVDHSGLTDEIQPGTPHNRLGGVSAIEYTGKDDVYLLLPDRGPADGAVPYQTRFHTARIRVRAGSTPTLEAKLLSTVMLTDEAGKPLVGSLADFDSSQQKLGRRLDPEGIRRSAGGSLFVSDEYGPFVVEFNSAGKRARFIDVPESLSIAHPAKTKELEDEKNTSGRQANGGMEGLAITPNGKSLFGLMQKPLIQDTETVDGKRRGVFTRLVQFDLETGKSRQFVYPLESHKAGISEILAVSDTSFLTLERDGEAGLDAKIKKVMAFDLADATDISSRESLPAKTLPGDVKPVSKRPFIDFLAPQWKLAGASFPEKVEGIAFGPTLPDGRRLLIVSVDNDFEPGAATLFYAFAIPDEELPGFAWKL